MNPTDLPRRRIASTVGYLLAGLVGTAVLTVVLLLVVRPLQRPVYDAVYLAVGPWTAEETAVVLTFTLASLSAIGLPTLVAAYVRGGATYARRVGSVAAGLLVLAAVLLAGVAYLGAIGLLAAAVAIVGYVVAILVSMGRLRGWPAGVATFAGGVPVLAVALLLLGFALGWGGGYDLVAREVPAATVNGTEAATFAEVPEVRDDLLDPSGEATDASCERGGEGRRTCRLPLRGYEHEARAARFLDRHGVRCPFRGAPADDDRQRSFVADDGGTYYRVSCVAYGD